MPPPRMRFLLTPRPTRKQPFMAESIQLHTTDYPFRGRPRMCQRLAGLDTPQTAPLTHREGAAFHQSGELLD